MVMRADEFQMIADILGVSVVSVAILVMKALFLLLDARLSLRCIAVEAVRVDLSKVQERRFVADLRMPVNVTVSIADTTIRILHVCRRRVEQVRDLILLLEELNGFRAHHS